MKTMNPYESELIAIAKARGDSISRQLVDVLIVKHAEIEALKAEINDLLGKNYVLSESGE